MRGEERIITVLNDVLTAELTAVNQYFVHARNLQRLGKINVGQTVPEHLRLDLDVERAAIKALNTAIELCRSLDDNGSRDLLEGILQIRDDA
jgi:bacterioferritin